MFWFFWLLVSLFLVFDRNYFYFYFPGKGNKYSKNLIQSSWKFNIKKEYIKSLMNYIKPSPRVIMLPLQNVHENPLSCWVGILAHNSHHFKFKERTNTKIFESLTYAWSWLEKITSSTILLVNRVRSIVRRNCLILFL